MLKKIRNCNSAEHVFLSPAVFCGESEGIGCILCKKQAAEAEQEWGYHVPIQLWLLKHFLLKHPQNKQKQC